ncbi:MAG: MAPEG family protein [Aquabacterium sp.]|nr:MAPEG family protein [Aquabacterium sp.]
MLWIDLVTVLALVQYLVFGAMVGQARGRYGVKAPATSGHEMFDRVYRVQMNTLELLVIFLPALWLAAKYWAPQWVAGLGAVYLLGRVIYLKAYMRDPASRTLGFALSFGPTVLLLLAALVGVIMAAR